VDIVGQDCSDSHEPTDFAGSEVIQLRMKIGVTNRGAHNIAFAPERLRLIASDGLRPVPVGADSPLIVMPGETKVASVRFMTRGGLQCSEELRLDLSDSLVAGVTPVSLQPIAFVARSGS